MRVTNEEVLQAGNASYLKVTGYADMDRDKNGFIRLKPTADRVDDKAKKLTTDISDLEAKLRQFKKEKDKVETYQKSDEYKESKKNKKGGKKQKKARNTLLEMVFNNADSANEPDDEDDEENEEGYRDSRKHKGEGKKKNENTLDTTYGKRFSPVVSLLHDSISEFDALAKEIEDELQASRNSSKSMYRSSQMGNLISAKNSKLSAVKELASVAKIVSDLEYKKSKDQKGEDADGTKAIARLGAKYLRGSIVDDDDDRKGKKKKGKDKDRKSYDKRNDDDDDYEDDDDAGSIRSSNSDGQRALAEELAKSLMKNKDKFSLTPHERYVSMEGKYVLMVAGDPTDMKDTWRFLAIDPKTGKEIPNFKDDYKGIVPKKKDCRMTFDLAKLKCTDKNTSRTYKLMFTK